MSVRLPYLASPGVAPKVLTKIQESRRPERFTRDFLETKLGHRGGSSTAMIPLLKRLGFLASDGAPTRLYDRFRNPDTQGQAMAEGLRNAYSELFDRNEYAYELSKDKLIALVTEMSGAEKDNRVVQCTVSTFLSLKEFADFEANAHSDEASSREETNTGQQNVQAVAYPTSPPAQLGFNVAYTINLNLPETTNPDVFNAIFKSLKDHLLKE